MPLCFAIADTESAGAYTRTVNALLNATVPLGFHLKPEHILQWHGDMHKGLEAARKNAAPGAVRVSDWAHVIGQTSQGPAGLPGLLIQKLGANADRSVLPWLLQWFRITRPFLKYISSFVWKRIFQQLQDWGHLDVCLVVQKQYFDKTVTASGEVLWDAHWRVGADRVMPGTASGSAPQESWHRHAANGQLGRHHGSVYELAADVEQKLVAAALRDVRRGDTELADWPGVGQFLDQSVLKSDPILNKFGRTSAKSLLALNMTRRFNDELGNTWILVPTSTLKRDYAHSARKTPVYRNREVFELIPDAERHYARICQALNEQTVAEALASLNLYDADAMRIKSWKNLSKALDDWRCVVFGPAVEECWEHHHVELLGAALRNKHMHSICFLCNVSAKWGPCEHQYAALMNEGIAELAEALARAKGRPRKSSANAGKGVPVEAATTMAPGPVVVALRAQAPGTSALMRHPTEQSRDSSQSSLSAEERELQEILRASGCGHHFRACKNRGVTVHMLKAFSFSDFYTCLGIDIRSAHAIMQALTSSAALETVAHSHTDGASASTDCVSFSSGSTARYAARPNEDTSQQYVLSQHGCVHRSLDGVHPVCKKPLLHATWIAEAEFRQMPSNYEFCTPVCFSRRGSFSWKGIPAHPGDPGG